MGRHLSSSLLGHRGPVVVVDEKYSWKRHTEYPASSRHPSPSPPPWFPSPPSPRSPSPRSPSPRSPSSRSPSPSSSPFSSPPRMIYSSPPKFSSPQRWNLVDYRGDIRAHYGSLSPHPVTPKQSWTQRHGVYNDKPYSLHASSAGEDEFGRRMRIAGEVHRDILRDHRQAQLRDTAKVNWKMLLDRESVKGKSKWASWGLGIDMGSSEGESHDGQWAGRRERIKILDHEWEGDRLRVKPDWDANKDRIVLEEYGRKVRKEKEQQMWREKERGMMEWNHEIDREYLGTRTGRDEWIEVRESGKDKGRREVVMVRRRKGTK